MSSLAYPRHAARLRRPDVAVVLSQRGTDVLLGVMVLLLLAGLLTGMTSDFGVDSWLALVAGRAVWQSGLPHVETLTVIGHGARWIDQQWLAQLTEYGLYRAGGLALVGVVNLLTFAVPVAAAVATARRFGAGFRTVVPVLAIATVVLAPAREIRTQDLAVPLFAAVAYLLAADSRTPSRRVYWCLALLALWANLHGTVSLGVALVVLRGLTLAWERRALLRGTPRAWARPAALVLGAPLAALVTPYGTAMPAYYRATMLSTTLRHWVSEWQPITSAPVVAAAAGVLAVLAIWGSLRRPGATTTWEKLALAVLAAGSVSVVRNVLFFGLLAVVLVPVMLTRRDGPSAPPAAGAAAAQNRGRVLINAALAATAIAALGLAAGSALHRSAAALSNAGQRPGVLATVAHAADRDPSLRILPDGRFADWLLWRDPALAGRVAADVRYEIYTDRQVSALESALAGSAAGWRRGAAGYRLVILNRAADTGFMQALLREPGHRVLYADGRAVVILRGAAGAARS